MRRPQQEDLIKKAINFHISNKIPFTENIFKSQTEMSNRLFAEARYLYEINQYKPTDEFEKEILESNLGQYVMYKNKAVPLDFPIKDAQNMFHVFVRDVSHKIKKIVFTNGFNTNCKDKCKPDYWSMRVDLFTKHGGLNGTSSLFL